MAAESPAGPMPMIATSSSAFGSGVAPLLRSSCEMNLTTSAPSLAAFLMRGVPDTSPMMKQPGTSVMNLASRLGTGRGLIFLVVLTTMHAFGLTGHSTWQDVSSMHWSGAMGEEMLSTMASTSCGQASTQAWQPMQRSLMMTGCG